MSQNENSLLLKIKGDSAGAKTAIAETRAAVATLRSSFGTEFGAMQNASSKAFASITDNLNAFVGQRIPLVGGAFVRLTGNIGGMAGQTDKADKSLEKLSTTISGIAKETGRSTGQITSFLTKFVQLETQAKRDTAAIAEFGTVAAQKLIPQLEKAGAELATVAASSTAAGSGIAAIAAPVGIAVVALAALAAGAVLLTKGLFDLAVAAADYRGKMFDMAQQTGVSTETLSALEIMAKRTGSSIEGIVAPLGIFQKLLEESHDPTSKAAKLLNELGVSNNNTEEALRQTLAALAKMPEGFHQTATALEIFGRGGRTFLAILKEMDGDLDGAIAQFRELGLVVSQEDAKAADELNDQLAILHFQFRALLGKEVIPAALTALQALSGFLKDNRAAVDTLGQAIGVLSGVVLVPFLQKLNDIALALQLVNALSIQFFGSGFLKAPVPQITPEGEFVSPGSTVPQGAGVTPFTPKTKTGAKPKTLQDEIYKAALEASKEASEKEIEEQRHLSVALKQAYELNLVNLAEYYRNRQGLVDLAFNEEIDAINREQEALDAARARGRIKKEDADKKDRELTERTIKAQNKLEEETNQLRIDNQRAKEKAELDLNRQLADLRVAQREGELNRVEYLLDRQIITESDAIGRRQKLEKDAHDDRVLLLEIELKAITTTAERKIAIDNELIESEQQRTDRFKELSQQRIDAMNRESAASAPGVNGIPTEPLGLGSELGRRIEEQVGPPPALQQHIDVVGTLRDAYEGLASSIAQGMGQIISNLVLFGKVGPQSFQKVLAASLAAVSAQAGIQAIYELALGIAALTPWGAAIYGPAVFHFKSAALLGSIALASGIAGRFVAGGSFSESGSGGGGASGGGGTASPKKPEAIEADRRNTQFNAQPQPVFLQPKITLTVVGQATEGFRYMVENVAVESVRLNGPFRKIQTGEGV